MKTLKTLLSVFAVAAVFSAGAYAQDASASVGATATVYNTLTITVNDSLSFGGIDFSNRGTVTIPADGSAISGPAGGGAQRADVSLSGTANASITIDFSDATLSDGTNTIAVDVYAYDGTTTENDDAESISSTLDGTGALTLNFGGEADFSTAAAGIYNTSNSSGSPISVTVNYD